MGETYIYHYGIKGMKWGVRRTPAQLGHRKKRSLKDAVNAIKKKTEAAAAKAASKPRTVKDMSDDELRRVLNRLDMEKRYRQYLSEANQKKQSRAKKIVADILEQGAKTLANKAFEAAAKQIFEKQQGEKTTDFNPFNVSGKSDAKLKAEIERAKLENQHRTVVGQAIESRNMDRAYENSLRKLKKKEKD